MKELIRFSLTRKLHNKMTIIFNVLLFVIMGLLFHVDYFVKTPSQGVNNVVLDNTVQERLPQLLNVVHEDYSYVTRSTGSEEEALLYYMNGWYIRSEQEIPEKLLFDIEKDIREAVSEDIYNKSDIKTRLYIDRYRSEVLQQVNVEKKNEDNPCWVILSVVFFLILSYGNMVGNDLVYEKASRTLSLILTSINPRDHFLARIITGYLTVIIQMLMGALMGVFWISVRYFNDGFTGLSRWLEGYVIRNSEVITVDISPLSVIYGVISILIGLLTVQVIMLVITSRFSGSEEASAFQGPLYLVMILIYYGFLVWGNTSFFTSQTASVLSYIPIMSMIFIPCRILLNDVSALETVISICGSSAFLLAIICALLPVYKRNLLNN